MSKRVLTLLLLASGFTFPMLAGVRADVEPVTPEFRHAESTVTSVPLPTTPKFKRMKVWVTAYSSTPDQTDDTPFITASGKHVRDGIVATNMLPLGTKVKIPRYFGDKVFVVEDRMHRRKVNFMDVWMDSREAALTFGIKNTEVIVLE